MMRRSRVVERRGELVDLLEEDAAQLAVGDVLLGGRTVAGEEVAVAWRCLSSSRTGASIERSLSAEALLHVDHVVLGDVEALGDQPRLDLDAEPLELALLLVEPEEELALGARRAESHQADVVEQVLEDVGADPVGRVGRELHALVRIEALDRLHQADVPLLDQVEDVGPGAAVLHRDLHDEPQVREHEPRAASTSPCSTQRTASSCSSSREIGAWWRSCEM